MSVLILFTRIQNDFGIKWLKYTKIQDHLRNTNLLMPKNSLLDQGKRGRIL